MKLFFKNKTEPGTYQVDVSLYNRSGEVLAFDYDNCTKQVYIEDVTINQAKRMIKSLEEYISDKKIIEANKPK